VLNHPSVTSAIVGMRTMEQLEEAVQTINVPFLSNSEIEQLQNSLPANYYLEHR
jgi:aryl-alcohol dehydrogenase-like predicted oxidoreductase